MPIELGNFPSLYHAASDHYSSFFLDVEEVKGLYRFPEKWRAVRLQIDQYVIWRERIQQCQSFEELEEWLNSHPYAIYNVPMVQPLLYKRSRISSFKFHDISRCENIDHRIYHTEDNCLEEEIKGRGWVGTLVFKPDVNVRFRPHMLELGLNAYGIYVTESATTFALGNGKEYGRLYDLQFVILDRDFDIKELSSRFQEIDEDEDDDFEDDDFEDQDFYFIQGINHGPDY